MSSTEISSSSWIDGARAYVYSLALRARTQLMLWCPQLTTLAIGLGVLPILITLSFVAGWIVYTSTPSEWSKPLYLQFGWASFNSHNRAKLTASLRCSEMAPHLTPNWISSRCPLSSLTTSRSTLLCQRQSRTMPSETSWRH